MSSAKKKTHRLDFRVSLEDKSKISRAVDFVGESMADFVLKRIMPEVDRIIARDEKIRLNNEAWTAFLGMLETPKTASSSLKKAMKEYRKTQGI
ncbi:MAG: DUF1778 domain-containing protein [Pseudomonadota bacterium]